MATENFSYTIPADPNGSPPNTTITVNATLTLSDTINIDNSQTVTGATGTYQVGGTTFHISGVSPGTDGADNHFWTGGNSSTGGFVNGNGITFITDDPTANGTAAIDPLNNPTPLVNFYQNAFGNYFEDTSTNGNSVQIAATNVTAAPCFVTGTLIRTACGDVAVEDLKVGDLALTTSGALRPIKWIGHRRLDCNLYPNPSDAMPIRISKDAFGPGKPERDLFVSPGHSICVSLIEEMFAPASSLVNGASIAQIDVDEVTYWHVELDTHDVILANGLPAESYFEMDNRAFFSDVEGHFEPRRELATLNDFCRPFLDEDALHFVRERLRRRAITLGWTIDETPPLDLKIIADGVVVQPDIDGLTARFILPASAVDVYLMSPTNVPRNVSNIPDGRSLGIRVGALSIDDGISARRQIALDDPLIDAGFHECESAWRWTSGRAHLPAALWEGCRGQFFLRIELASPPMPRWVAPSVVEQPATHTRENRLRLVASA